MSLPTAFPVCVEPLLFVGGSSHLALASFFGVRPVILGSAVGRTYFMAYPEKAIVDMVELRRGVKIFSQRDLAARLFEDLRMDEGDVAALDVEIIEKFAESYGTAKTRLLVKLVNSMRRS